MPDTTNPAEDGAVEALAKAFETRISPAITSPRILELERNACRLAASFAIPALHAAGYVVVPREATEQRQWRHVKRETVYAEIGRAELQAARDLVEGATLVVYRGADGKLWARQEDEFEDGRFVEIAAPPAAAERDGE